MATTILLRFRVGVYAADVEAAKFLYPSSFVCFSLQEQPRTCQMGVTSPVVWLVNWHLTACGPCLRTECPSVRILANLRNTKPWEAMGSTVTARSWYDHVFLH